jgi:hypothetical protein
MRVRATGDSPKPLCFMVNGRKFVGGCRGAGYRAVEASKFQFSPNKKANIANRLPERIPTTSCSNEHENTIAVPEAGL